ncbi:MAG TPA: hypothetical protein VGK67_34740 [Myxococcales bacterium]|jgi:hypothetical protein
MKSVGRTLAMALLMVLAGFGGGCPYQPKSDLLLAVDGATPFSSNAGGMLWHVETAQTVYLRVIINVPGSEGADREWYDLEVRFDQAFFESAKAPLKLEIAGAVSGESRAYNDITQKFEPGAGHDSRVTGVFLHRNRGTNATEPTAFSCVVHGSLTFDQLEWETSPSWHNPKLLATIDLSTQGGLPSESPTANVQTHLTGTIGAYVDSPGY